MDIVRGVGRFFVSKLFLALLIILLAWQLLIAKLELWDERGIRRAVGAYGGYLFEVASTGCVPQDIFLTAAKERGWETVVDGPAYDPPANSASHIRVFIVPEIPFSKEPGRLFFFDTRGCLIRRGS